MLNKRHLGRHYRISTLDLLGRLGYGTTRQIAKGVWGQVTESTRKMANRTITQLVERGYLLEKRDDVNSERLVAVTKAGADMLEYALPKDRPSAKDWLRHAHDHRTAANSVFVAAAGAHQLGGVDSGWTELEIRAGEAPDHLASYAFRMDGQPQLKIPDGIIQTEHGYVWIEVENAYRGARDFAKCVAWLRAMFWEINPPVAEVWFVVTAPGAATIGRRLREALRPGDFTVDARPVQAKDHDRRVWKDKVKVQELDSLHLTLHLSQLER
jgi:DNA-binding MarR family transcriptional regulator